MLPEELLWLQPTHSRGALTGQQSQCLSSSHVGRRGLEVRLIPAKLTRRETLDTGCNGGLDDILLRLLLVVPEHLHKGKDGMSPAENLSQAFRVSVVDRLPGDLGWDTLRADLLDGRVS